jgi:hypothetical protein
MSKETQKMTARILSAVLAAGACMLMAPPLASAAAPAFKLTATSQPTNLIPGTKTNPNFGPQYSVIATNVGSTATGGSTPVTITDVLPAGVTATSATIRDFNTGLAFLAPCSISGQTVTCIDSSPLQPGQWAQVLISVEVDESASGSAVDQASVVGGGAGEATTTTTTTIGGSIPSFGFLPGAAGFSVAATGIDGQPATLAGSHPYGMTVDLGFPTAEAGASPGVTGPIYSAGHLRDVRVSLPRGMAVNPTAVPVRCTESQLESEQPEAKGGCPVASQIGVLFVLTKLTSLFSLASPIYNMVPPPGAAAEFATSVGGLGIFVHIIGSVNSAGEYELRADSNNLLAREGNPILGGQVQLWGDPSDPSHDHLRNGCGLGFFCSTEPQATAFLTMPDSCRTSLVASASADSWEDPSLKVQRSPPFEDPSDGTPTSTVGCDQLGFEPTIEAKPTTNLSESPSGLDFHLHQPQRLDFDERATASVKDLTIALPKEMTLNPAAADGLKGCSSAQIGLKSPIGQSPIHFSDEPAGCPEASRLGTVEVNTPLVGDYDSENKVALDPEGKATLARLRGSVYLAEPFDNPFDSLLAIYFTVEDPVTGVIAKVAGKISADPQTGQLVTRVSESPELPLEDVNVHFFGGARAPLISPPLCGTHTTTATFTPWSSPEGKDVDLNSSFATSDFPGGGSCPTSAGAAPNHPTFEAGTIAPLAGAYSPFVVKLDREDGSQRLSGVQATLPPGLIGKLAGVAQCSEAQLGAAKAREVLDQGVIEQASPSCPASSEIGTIEVSAGAGSMPLHVQGHAYLAGPYKGAPLSLAIITPAVAGPFDLGAVVIRVALRLDPQNAQIHAVSDPFPTVLQGIPLDVRGAALKLGRPDFTLNPTSCDPMAIEGTADTVPGQVAPLHSPFQLGGCGGLGFRPSLALNLKGGTKRGGHPGLTATYTPRKGDANVKGLVVRLPRSAFLDQAHIRTICTRVQFAAKSCPPAAQYGYIKAWTPLLEEPLEGPVWLRSSSHKLPDLVFDLHGIVDVEVATRIDSAKGGIRATVESAPDAPLSKVVLKMQGGKKGLIINSRNLCGGTNKVNVQFTGHNGKERDSKPVLKADCGGKRKRHHRHS